MSRRRAACLTLPVLALALTLTSVPGAQAEPADTLTITSPELNVRVGADFPQVVDYTDRASGAVLGGQPETLDQIIVNGTTRTVELAGDPVLTDSRASYRLTVPDLPGLGLTASLSVDARVVTFTVDELTDPTDGVVNTLEIPGHSLVSVTSDDAGASTAFTTLDPDSTRTADRFAEVTADTATQDAPAGAAYAVLDTDELAAAIETNATVDQPTGAEGDDGTRLHHQAVAEGDGVRVGLWSGEWTVRGATAPYREPLPWAKVVLTGDANDDDTLDWQDGAVAFRTIMSNPNGAEEVPDRVVSRIAMNFASQATHPFLRTLDDTKRIALATDGLGQYTNLKGYGSEGHDSAHPDYAGNYNTRAGGLADLRTLTEEGAKWNADFQVHVNATESYPEARAFSEKLVDPSAKGWNWLNQSYYIKQRPDLATGAVVDRFAQLREEVPALDGLYIDVYYSSGWLADSLSRQLADQGWTITTEWADRFEESALWSHWANDLNYGGATNKGLNSDIIRFIRNHQKDVWNADPILGRSQLEGFEGWTGENDWDFFMETQWDVNLPTKFFQTEQILAWSEDEIRLTGDLRGTVEDGVRHAYVGDAEVLRGDSYLIPWTSDGAEADDKLYHWNPDGGSSSWDVPAPFTGVRTFDVYELTDQGKKKVDVAVNRKGTVNLRAKADTAYVLYPQRTADVDPAPRWGQGSGLIDPGFNAADLVAWNPTGDTSITTLGTGVTVAELGAGRASIAQPVTGLRAGVSYSASAWVEIEPGETRDVTVSVTGGTAPATVSIQRSTAKNLVAADEKHDTYFQRVPVRFTASADRHELRIAAGDGDARVLVDDVRVVASADPSGPGSIAAADFEDVDQGWWPFVKGDAGGSTDPRTVLARRHEPYTQSGWNGKRVDDALNGEWSLKAHEENAGLVYRTVPQSVRFEPGHAYRVELDHQNGRSGQYEWVVGTDRVLGGVPTPVDLQRTPLTEQLETARFSQTFVAGCGGDTWVGLRKLVGGGDQADLVLDDFTVTDLGPSDDGATCSSIGLSGAGLAGMVQGEPNPVVSTLTNNGETAITDVTLALEVPSGWTAEPVSGAEVASIAAGESAEVAWSVTPAADAEPGGYPVTATASYTSPDGPVTVSRTQQANVLPEGIVPQSRITVESVSSTEPEGGEGHVSDALDGNPSSIWHTAWSRVPTPDPYPHEVVLDLGADYAVDGFVHLPRQVGTNGRMKDYELYLSEDGRTWGEPVSTGSFLDGTAETRLEFTATEARYVKLIGLSSQNGGVFGGAAELNVLGSRVG